MNDIANLVNKILNESAYLKLKGIESGSALTMLSYKIAEHIIANYNLKKKNAWFGIDLDSKINELKQDLAIAYSYKKKFGHVTPKREEKTEPDLFERI